MNFLKAFLGGSNDALTVNDANTRIESGEPLFILDVRQPEEFRSGHIKGAKLIPLGQLSTRINEVPKDKTILCVCASGSRSGIATAQLKNAGYTVLNLRGGMAEWSYAGFAIKTGK